MTTSEKQRWILSVTVNPFQEQKEQDRRKGRTHNILIWQCHTESHFLELNFWKSIYSHQVSVISPLRGPEQGSWDECREPHQPSMSLRCHTYPWILPGLACLEEASSMCSGKPSQLVICAYLHMYRGSTYEGARFSLGAVVNRWKKCNRHRQWSAETPWRRRKSSHLQEN